MATLHQKLQEIRSFGAQYLNGLKFSEVEVEVETEALDPEELIEIEAFHESKIPPLEEAIQEFRIRDKNYCQSYIGQVCLLIQVVMYQHVLPDQFAEGWLYKVKDIEEDIADEDLLTEEEREEASKRWEGLKEQIRWDPSLERTLEMFEEKANSSMVRPECLVTVEGAERAAKELNKQGRLKGTLSYEKVKQIIEMWKKLKTLVQ